MRALVSGLRPGEGLPGAANDGEVDQATVPVGRDPTTGILEASQDVTRRLDLGIVGCQHLVDDGYLGRVDGGPRPETEGGGGYGHGGGHHHGGGQRFFRGGDDNHQGAARFGLLDLPEPVTAADTNFNRGVSLEEFRQAAGQRFLALDLDNHGYLTLPDLQRIRPAPPPEPNRNDAPSAPPPDSSDGAVVPGNY